jgi:hypothetical protein
LKTEVKDFMKKTKLVGLIAAALIPLQTIYGQPAPASEASELPPQVQSSAEVPNDLSPAAAEVVRLAESGVGDEVVTSYIQNSKSVFGLTADHILYLKDLGVSSESITAMLNHDKGLPTSSAVAEASTPAPSAPSAPQLTSQPVAAPVPAPVASPAPAYVSNPPIEVNYFYNDLSPYGTWISLEGYGWCWQPRAVVVNRSWRPYCDGGHWIYTDAGWYWQSDYSWGWAPFHYGRWQMHDRCGWVWMPDRVWGPAWVVWRSYGDNCGWAPVPPRATFEVGYGWRFNGVHVGLNFDFGLRSDHFTFIAMRDFNHRDYGHYRMPRTEVTKIYNRTTVINNYTVNNNTIVNRGIAVDRVASATHTQVRKATIRDLPAGANRTVVTRTADRNNVVYRPELRAPSRPVKVVAQKVDDRNPVIRHTDLATTPVPRRIERDANRGPQSSNDRTPSSRAGRPESTTQPSRPSERDAYRAPQPSNQRAASSREGRPDTRVAPAVPSAPAAPAARSYDDVKPTPRANPTPTYRTETRSTPPAQARQAGEETRSTPPGQARQAGEETRSAPPGQTRQATVETRPVPPGQARQAEVRGNQPQSRGNNPHVYYPKSQQQSADVRSLPQADRHRDNGKDKSNSRSGKQEN